MIFNASCRIISLDKSSSSLRKHKWRRSLGHTAVVALALAGLHAVTTAGAQTTSYSIELPVSIFLFGPDGSPINVTGLYSFHDNHLYDPDNAVVGTGDANGNIWDSSEVLIGYVTSGTM